MGQVLSHAEPEPHIENIRGELRHAQSVVQSRTDKLVTKLPDLGLTARTAYLQTLAELIGKPPPDKTWEDKPL